MSELQNKIDFKMVVTVNNANPNGDPLNGNMPRVTDDGFGEISDVCLKRKIRNRLQDMGETIFVQSDDKNVDDYKSLRDRANANAELVKAEKGKDKKAFEEVACRSWMDVRAFGQVFAFKAEKGEGVSVGVRGPVSIHPAFSIEPVDITSLQITKSVNSESNDKGKKSSDTMGMKHRVNFGVYEIKGSINVQLAEKTGFSEEDAEKIKEALRTIFMNDVSSARPDGSMEVVRLFWWRHSNKIGQYSSAKVHNSIEVIRKSDVTPSPKIDFERNFDIKVTPLEGLQMEEYYGI